MAGAAALAIIVIPILMGFWIRGKFLPRQVTPEPGADQSVSSFAAAGPPLAKTTLLVAALSIFTVIWPLSQVGGEFLPKINEGDLLYMPSTLPASLRQKLQRSCRQQTS